MVDFMSATSSESRESGASDAVAGTVKNSSINIIVLIMCFVGKCECGP
jgi:hypothetical protein